jgi:nicotinamidase-related amidase
MKNTLLLLIDFQTDFIDTPGAALAVSGSSKDVERLVSWARKNIDSLQSISVSLDTHTPRQIFHPVWWKNQDGEHPAPFTQITLQDLESGKWIGSDPENDLRYVQGLADTGKKALMVWPYHCLLGTTGHTLTPAVAQLLHDFSVQHDGNTTFYVKGTEPNTEYYGIFGPEYCYGSDLLDTKAMEQMADDFENIVIAGEAKSHCVQETIAQLVQYYKVNNPWMLDKIFILEDCMSVIPGFEESTKAAFETFEKEGVHLVTTETLIL